MYILSEDDSGNGYVMYHTYKLTPYGAKLQLQREGYNHHKMVAMFYASGTMAWTFDSASREQIEKYNALYLEMYENAINLGE